MIELVLAAAAIAAAPSVAPAPAPDAAAVVAATISLVEQNYVVAAKRPAIVAALRKGLASGAYAKLEPTELAARISSDMDAVAHDKHLGLSFQPEMAARLSPAGEDDESSDSAAFVAFARRLNHGVREMRVLDGNIRLVSYEGFAWTGAQSAAAIDQAMAFVRGGDAAIIDLRDNGGGSPEAVRRLTSYFVKPGTPLVTFHLRRDPPTTSVSEAVPGGPISAPVYILTGPHSASATEEFASHALRLGFATLVGEPTAGAAYRNDRFPIAGGYVLSVSIGYPDLPGGGNWEGVGVAPAIPVAADLALDRAIAAASTTLAAKADANLKTDYLWAAALHSARVTPVVPPRPLTAYAGRFGERNVKVEGGKLVYQRDGGRATPLLAIAPDLFALEADPRSRVRFTGSGAVTGFTIERADGRTSVVPRS
jgi:hypothetical protein